MKATSNWLVHDHRKYDALLEDCELAAGAGEWKEAIALFRELIDDLGLHIRMEEEVLYPMFERKSGDPQGEIAMLREEHEEIERLLRDLMTVIKIQDFDHLLDSLIPLHKAMKEHNAHEETVFLGPDGEALLARREDILERLKALEKREGRPVWDFSGGGP